MEKYPLIFAICGFYVEKGPGSMALVASTHAVGFFYMDCCPKNAGKASLSPLTN
jgi:hypothetical protein